MHSVSFRFNACCRCCCCCAFTKRLVVFHFRCILYLFFLISIPELGQCTSASGCAFFFPTLPRCFACRMHVLYLCFLLLLIPVFAGENHAQASRTFVLYILYLLFITFPVLRHQNAEECSCLQYAKKLIFYLSRLRATFCTHEFYPISLISEHSKPAVQCTMHTG